jgi:protein kinase/serine/threonine-protein kinase
MPIKSDPERWQRLKNILADALEQSSLDERTALLRQACANDATLLCEAEKLLTHNTTAFEEFAEFATTDLRNGTLGRIGERLGAYVIIKELGRGGMGAVYLAERADGQFEKRVAIKVLKRGTDTEEVLRRFRIERQILANLEHPNITRLVDAGTTGDGLPYFVMEFVEGVPITRIVEHKTIDLRGRLKLFLKVCTAIALSHRHHVIHRDIKPGNVLVNADGEPKLLDFGVAKLLGADSDDVSTTVATERRFTPMYAAPEQRAGQPATVATDVYALGALLYELVTGLPPCSSRTGHLATAHGSDQPSQPAVARQPVTDPRTEEQLHGELDQIVARAMQEDPARRYSSVSALSEDIEHFLNDSGPGKMRYSATGSHHRWYVGALAFAAVGLAAALLLPLRRNLSKPETVNEATNPASAISASTAAFPSIAVLPFENLSEEKENAYFADGIQEDILTTLSKIGDLKVISRRSVMTYRGSAFNVRQIGQTLGVSAILEGSVRRSGNRVRVNVQLIDAENDEQIWAEDYDRDLSDVFAIQTDLAHKIASELHAKLSPSEMARIGRKPTENWEAYLAFLQAQNLAGAHEDFDKLKQSEVLYERAISLDPKFALAAARYSELESWIEHIDRAATRKEKARSLAQRALELEPDLPEGQLALGFSYYYGDGNYNAALREFEIAQRGLPNDSEVYLALGSIQRRQGKWEESTANLEKAISLSPKDIWLLKNLTFNYQVLRDFDAANKTIDRALNMNSNDSALWHIKASLAVNEKGDLSVAEKALAAINRLPARTGEQKVQIFSDRADLLTLLRKYPELLQEADSLPDMLSEKIPDVSGGKYYFIGIAREALHQEIDARGAFLREKSIAEMRRKQNPNDEEASIQLATVLACLGERDAALVEAERATNLLPESKDAFVGPEIAAEAAAVHAFVGDTDRAVEILEGLLSRPGWLTAQRLKVDPAWDPLRNDWRFQALLNKYGGGG